MDVINQLQMFVRQQFFEFITDSIRNVLYVGNIVKCALRDGLIKV